MKNDEAINYLENMKWLKGYDNTMIGDKPIVDIIDGIIALLKEQEEEIENLKQTAQSMMEGIVVSQPQIIRCKDCKYWRKLLLNQDGDGCCRADNDIHVTHPDWFCADGERKEGR